jgi:hypothetical protein
MGASDMKADDCSIRCCAIGKFGAKAGIERLPRTRRHDMLYATYVRACSGATREDLCQILILDIEEAIRLQSQSLAADLLVVLEIVVRECGLSPIEHIVAFQTPVAPTLVGGEHAA